MWIHDFRALWEGWGVKLIQIQEKYRIVFSVGTLERRNEMEFYYSWVLGQIVSWLQIIQ